MNKLGRKIVPLLLCCMLVLSACSSGVPANGGSSSSGGSPIGGIFSGANAFKIGDNSLDANEIPLLLRYNDKEQRKDNIVKAIWNLEKGEMDIDEEVALTIENTTEQNQTGFLGRSLFIRSIREDWTAEKRDFWAPLIYTTISNTAVYWDGSNKLTLFTTEEYPSQKLQGNGLSANIVTIKNNPPMCAQYVNATNCVATDKALYAFGHLDDISLEEDTDPATPWDVSSIYKVTDSEVKTATVDGRVIGIGKLDDNVYALSAVTHKTATVPGSKDLGQYLVLYTIKPDGSISSQTVKNSEVNSTYYSTNGEKQGIWATFANGSFYLGDAKVDVTAITPEYKEIKTLVDGFMAIPYLADYYLGLWGATPPTPAFYAYKDYLLVLGNDVKFQIFTVAVFKNEKLVGFFTIDSIGSLKSTLTIYDATGKQVNSYTIEAPDQIIVPQLFDKVTNNVESTPFNVSSNEIPLLVRYRDLARQNNKIYRIAWDPVNGTVNIDDEFALTPKDTRKRTFYTYMEFPSTENRIINTTWRTDQEGYWSILMNSEVSNTAVWWDGADKMTLFTMEEYPSNKLQGNGISADIVKVSNPPLCIQYLNATNCVATSTTLYTFGYATRGIGANYRDITKYFRVMDSETKTATLAGRIIGIGKHNDNIYALSVIFYHPDKWNRSISNEYLVLHTIKPDGTVKQQTVKNSDLGNRYYTGKSTFASLVNGYFYLGDAKIDVTAETPEYIKTPSIVEGLQTTATLADFLRIDFYGSTIPTPAFYGYKDYLLAVGKTFGPKEFTVAAFKDEKLVGFMLITPTGNTINKIITFDATGKQLNTYIIPPVSQVIVPQP